MFILTEDTICLQPHVEYRRPHLTQLHVVFYLDLCCFIVLVNICVVAKSLSHDMKCDLDETKRKAFIGTNV